MKKQFLESVVTYTFLNYLNVKNKYDKGKMSLQETLKTPEKMLESFFKNFEPQYVDEYLFEWNLNFNESNIILNENYSFEDLDEKIKKSFIGVKVILEKWINSNNKNLNENVSDWLKKQAAKLFNFSLNDIIEGFRGVVSGTGGTIAQLILSFTGPIGGGIVLAVNAVLLLGDIYQFSIGSKDFSYFNVIFDLLGTAVAFGSVRASLAPAKTVLAAEKTAAGFFGKLAQKLPNTFELIRKIGSGLMKAVKWVSSGLKTFISWITKWLPGFSKLIKPLKNALSKLGSWLNNMVKSISNVGKKLAQKVVSKVAPFVTKFGNKPVGQALKDVLIKGQKLGLRGLETKVGKIAVQGVDNYIVGQVEDYLRGEGSKLTLSAAQKAMCVKSAPHCTVVNAFAKLVR